MNDMSQQPKPDGEYEIVLLGIKGADFYLLDGEKHLDQMLLADGDFPRPILMLNFSDVFSAKQTLGSDFSLVGLWGVHPAIVERLRNTKCLVEKDG